MNHDNLTTEGPILTGAAFKNEQSSEKGLRPQSLADYIGQTKIVDNVKVMIESAKKREAALDHILLSGPPGLGKTSLAMLMASELNGQLHIISGPALEKKGDLAALLTNLEPRDILFIDEIHRMSITVEEILYSAMEDYRLDIVIGQGPSARTMQIDLMPFTLIGATTKSGLLSNPLRDRFLAHFHFDFYSDKSLTKIILNNSHKIGLKCHGEALEMIAKCSRGTPRIANRILRRVRDFALVQDTQEVGAQIVASSLELMDISADGLDRMDRKIIKAIKEHYQGGPVGIDALCAALSEDRYTVEEVHEPYLLKKGLVIRTPRGRALSEKGLGVL